MIFFAKIEKKNVYQTDNDEHKTARPFVGNTTLGIFSFAVFVNDAKIKVTEKNFKESRFGSFEI